MSIMEPVSVCLSEWENLQMIIIWDVTVDMAALAMIAVWIPIGHKTETKCFSGGCKAMIVV